MCGIVGIFTTKSKINPSQLDSARDALAHRGPDGKGSLISQNQQVGLAHRRLTIVGAKSGAQPLFNRDKSICASVNGEFYGYKTLRRQLENAGYVFTTDSDSELIIHLYEEYGLDFVRYLRGEFAFLLYDERNNRMIAVRDRFGIKPLCYYSSEGVFYAASEAKALFKLGITPAWDEYALYHAFCFQYPPLNATLFQDIHQVPAGHMMIFDGKTLENKAYWDLDYSDVPEDEHLDISDLTAQLDSKLREAIGLRLELTDVPVCCHLSGGVDSASISAIAAELNGSALPCFTVAFPNEAYNEFEFAKNLAQKINAPFHPIMVGAHEMTNALSDAVYFTEGLAINNHLSAKYILNQEIKKAGYKVALSGEGSDELFAGYLHFQEDYAPLKIGDNIATGIHTSTDQGLSVDHINKSLGFIPSFIKAKAAIGYKMHALLDPTKFTPEQVMNDITNSNNVSQTIANLHPVHKSSYLWIKYGLSSYILKTLGDGCEMAHGIEGRVPFLDHQLFAFAKKIPLSLKIRPGTDKYILRETVKKYITEEIYNRKKQPFIAPPFSLMSDAKGYEFLRDSLYSCNTLPFVNSKKVQLYLDSIPKKSIRDQQAAEPVIMLLLTTTLLGQRYSL